MNEATKQLFLKLNLEQWTDGSAYVDWAVDCLEEGFDSKSLRLLAGFDKKHPYKIDFEELFRQSLNELGWRYLTDEEVLFDYAKSLAKEILSEEITPAEGVEKINSIFFQLGYPDELKMWNLLYEGHSYAWYDKSRWIPFMSTFNQNNWLEAVKLEATYLASKNFLEVTK
jgi:hypothetical protein